MTAKSEEKVADGKIKPSINKQCVWTCILQK